MVQEVKLNDLQPFTDAEKKAGNTIPAIILPEGYNGKILLLSVTGD
jgi:hypothetical protein